MGGDQRSTVSRQRDSGDGEAWSTRGCTVHMRDYAEIFGPAMLRFGSSRQLKPFSNMTFADSTSRVLEEQRVRAGQFRLQQQTDTTPGDDVLDELRV